MNSGLWRTAIIIAHLLAFHTPAANSGPETLGARNYYDRLGVSSDDTREQIQKAYRALILQYHPDRYPRATAVQQAALTRAVQLLNEAADTLLDDNLRRAYNRVPGVLRPRPSAPIAPASSSNPPAPPTSVPPPQQTGRASPSQPAQSPRTSAAGRILKPHQQEGIAQPTWAQKSARNPEVRAVFTPQPTEVEPLFPKQNTVIRNFEFPEIGACGAVLRDELRKFK